VQTLVGEAVWKQAADRFTNPELLNAWSRLPAARNGNRSLRDAVPNPALFILEYADGLRAFLFELTGPSGIGRPRGRYAGDGTIASTLFWTQEARPAMHSPGNSAASRR